MDWLFFYLALYRDYQYKFPPLRLQVDLPIFSMYAVHKRKWIANLLQVNLHWEADPVPLLNASWVHYPELSIENVGVLIFAYHATFLFDHYPGLKVATCGSPNATKFTHWRPLWKMAPKLKSLVASRSLKDLANFKHCYLTKVKNT